MQAETTYHSLLLRKAADLHAAHWTCMSLGKMQGFTTWHAFLLRKLKVCMLLVRSALHFVKCMVKQHTIHSGIAKQKVCMLLARSAFR
jgi:hypothetical protein